MGPDMLAYAVDKGSDMVYAIDEFSDSPLCRVKS